MARSARNSRGQRPCRIALVVAEALPTQVLDRLDQDVGHLGCRQRWVGDLELPQSQGVRDETDARGVESRIRGVPWRQATTSIGSNT